MVHPECTPTPAIPYRHTQDAPSTLLVSATTANLPQPRGRAAQSGPARFTVAHQAVALGPRVPQSLRSFVSSLEGDRTDTLGLGLDDVVYSALCLGAAQSAICYAACSQ